MYKNIRNIYKCNQVKFNMVFDRIKKVFSDTLGERGEDSDYLEIDLG